MKSPTVQKNREDDDRTNSAISTPSTHSDRRTVLYASSSVISIQTMDSGATSQGRIIPSISEMVPHVVLNHEHDLRAGVQWMQPADSKSASMIGPLSACFIIIFDNELAFSDRVIEILEESWAQNNAPAFFAAGIRSA